MKHSAVLTVRQKFDNVLALNLDVSLHYKPKGPEQSSTVSAKTQSSTDLAQEQSTVKPQESYNLEEFLDVIHMEAQREEWIENRRKVKHPTTFRELLNDFRDMLEHEIEYIPPEVLILH